MRTYCFVVFLLFINTGNIFPQEKIFLSSERNWVTVLEYWDWNENEIANYSGKYEIIHAVNDEDGNYNGEGDAYNYITEISFKSGVIQVLVYGSIEGTFEGIDTLTSSSISGNTLNNNGKFVFLKYKTRNKKIKTVKGILELGENKLIEYFSEYIGPEQK